MISLELQQISDQSIHQTPSILTSDEIKNVLGEEYELIENKIIDGNRIVVIRKNGEHGIKFYSPVLNSSKLFPQDLVVISYKIPSLGSTIFFTSDKGKKFYKIRENGSVELFDDNNDVNIFPFGK